MGERKNIEDSPFTRNKILKWVRKLIRRRDNSFNNG
jgi:hypothetical protein